MSERTGEWVERVHAQERQAARESAPLYDQAYETAFYRVERRAFGRHLRAVARRAHVDLRDSCALDVGCGTGSVLSELKRLGVPRLFAIDISPEMIDIARAKHPDVSFHAGPIEDAPYSPSSFDLVTGFSVLHHLPDLRRFFLWLSTVLRVGGIFAFSEPNAASVVSEPAKWTWARRSTSPLHRLLVRRNRGWPSRVPDMSDERFYSEAHRSLTLEDVRGAACDRLALDIVTHGVLTVPYSSAVRDRRLDRAVLTTLNAVDRLLPLQGYLLFITGRRVR